MTHVRYQSTHEEINDLRQKLRRLRNQQPLRVVDLFSGCGGMSLGLHRAGFEVLGGVEINPKAVDTHAKNFFSHLPEDDLAPHRVPRDIRTFAPERFMREVLHAEQRENLVDVIVGGPPCQAFARVGRAKLRHLRQDPNAHLSDERVSLYIQYLQYVDFFRPLVVIMENVPDIMNHSGTNVAETIADTLEEMGYKCRYTILNSAHYGVPQLRQRFYLIAFLDALDVEPSFPSPTHFIELSIGYEHARASALGSLSKRTQQLDLFNDLPTRYVALPPPSKALPPAVTAKEAIGDLPAIRYHLQNRRGRGLVRNFDTLARYGGEPSEYAINMRTWPQFESENDGVWDHVIRLLPRDYPIFRRMKQGDQYPEAYEVAKALFQVKKRNFERRKGMALEEGSEEYMALWKETVPPYDAGKFPNKWWKLIEDYPSRTLTAHMGKDTYSHIHYDKKQARVISVREAARLQSFPDGFKFTGPMGPAFTQIGNAVSPLMAYRFGVHVQQLLQAALHSPYIVKDLPQADIIGMEPEASTPIL